MKLSGISIKWKILLLVLLGPLVIAVFLSWQRINDIRSGAEKAIISKSAGIVMMAEATRDQMAKKLQSGVLKPFDQLTPPISWRQYRLSPPCRSLSQS